MNTESPLTPFETALLTELRETVGQRAAAPAKRRRRSIAAVAAAGLAALATGIGITSMGGSPAFAVQTAADGDVVVRIHELTDAAGLEKALADQGVTATVEYGGDAGNAITVDQDGKVSPGNVEPSREVPAGGKSVTREGGAQSGASPELSTTPSGDDPCGPTAELPVAVARNGSDFVITIDGDSAITKEDIRITTLSRGEGADIVVTFAPVAGLMCALGTSTD
jgi:hypothetical protein